MLKPFTICVALLLAAVLPSPNSTLCGPAPAPEEADEEKLVSDAYDLYYAGDNEEAFAKLDACLRINADNVPALNLRSALYANWGQWDESLAGSNVDGGTKNAQDVYIDNDDQTLDRVKEWYGEEFQWVLMSHYPGNQALDEAMAGLRAARGYLEPDKAFRKVLSLKSYTWDELAASYLMQSFRMLGEAEGKPEFQAIMRPVWKLHRDSNGEEEFSIAVVRMLSLIPVHAVQVVDYLLTTDFRGRNAISVMG